jgi:DNA-binding HxlR family transcriptional regulator
VRRYGQMQRNLGIARNILADRLKQPGDRRSLRAGALPHRSDWYEYRLTERALDLYPMIVGLMRWAERHLGGDGEVVAPELVHRSCGKRVDPYLA